MRKVATVFAAIGITVILTTFAVGFGAWAPYSYWGGGYYGSSGMSYWPSSYGSSYSYAPSSSSGMYVSPSSYSRVSYYYPSSGCAGSGVYYWPSSSSRRSLGRFY